MGRQHPADEEAMEHSGDGDPPADEEVGWPAGHNQDRFYSDTIPPGTFNTSG